MSLLKDGGNPSAGASRKEAVSLAGRIRDIEPLQIKDEKQRAWEYKTAYYSQDYLNLVRNCKRTVSEERKQRERRQEAPVEGCADDLAGRKDI